MVFQKLTFDDEQVKKELKAYTSSDPIVKKNTLREMYNSKMNEQANLGKVNYIIGRFGLVENCLIDASIFC